MALQPFQDEPAVFGLRGRQWLALAVLVACGHVFVSVGSLTVLWNDFTRTPTPAEVRSAAVAEVAGRWQRWPVGRIFPEQVAYALDGRAGDAGVDEIEMARRIGVAPATGCAEVLDPKTADVVAAQGCKAVLRATYLDQLQGVVMTVGVVVFPDEWSAYRARRDVPGNATTLRALSFPGTVTSRFTDEARQRGTAERAGPYIVLTASGYADGRPAALTPKRRDEIFDVASAVAEQIARTLSTQALPDCTSREWKC